MRRNRRSFDPNHVPLGPFTVNRNSPQAKGLTHWFPAAATRGAFSVPNIADYGFDPIAAAGAAGFAQTQHGPGMDLPGGAQATAFWGKTAGFTISSPSTICLWLIRGAGGEGNEHAIDINHSADTYRQRIALRVGTAADWFMRDPSGDTLTPTLSSSPQNVLAHHCLAWKAVGTDVESFVNGVTSNTANDPAFGTSITFEELRLGTERAGGSAGFDGQILDFRIYNTLKSAAEISEMWHPETRWDLYLPVQRVWAVRSPVVAGRIMSSLVDAGGLASRGGIAGPGGGLAG